MCFGIESNDSAGSEHSSFKTSQVATRNVQFARIRGTYYVQIKFHTETKHIDSCVFEDEVLNGDRRKLGRLIAGRQ
jgi:hypothetical protein